MNNAEQILFDKIESQRDELVAALRMLLANPSVTGALHEDQHRIARAALAKVCSGTIKVKS